MGSDKKNSGNSKREEIGNAGQQNITVSVLPAAQPPRAPLGLNGYTQHNADALGGHFADAPLEQREPHSRIGLALTNVNPMRDA